MTVSEYQKLDRLLWLQHVSLSFNGRPILRDINTEVRNIVRPGMIQGQVIGLLGPSGMGKSQLARIIAGLQKQTSGEVTVGSSNQAARKGLVGMVAQNYILFNWTTVLQNLLIAGKQGGMSPEKAFDKANGFVDEFELRPYLNMYPRQLSGGTRQRVAIIQQLMCSDHFLIMDEPFSGLDLIMKARACELITKVASLDELNTIIVVTHDVTEAASISDTLWLLGREWDKDGRAPIAGARIVEEYDLAAMGLSWHPDIIRMPEFQEFVVNVKTRFATL